MEKAVWIFVVANGGRKEQMAVRRSGRSIKKKRVPSAPGHPTI